MDYGSRELANHAHTLRSLGRATPFDGWGVSAAVALTICGGEIAYHDLQNPEEVLP
jgi:dihydroorotase